MKRIFRREQGREISADSLILWLLLQRVGLNHGTRNAFLFWLVIYYVVYAKAVPGCRMIPLADGRASEQQANERIKESTAARAIIATRDHITVAFPACMRANALWHPFSKAIILCLRSLLSGVLPTGVGIIGWPNNLHVVRIIKSTLL